MGYKSHYTSSWLLIPCVIGWYCWCFRSPKQPPGMYKTLWILVQLVSFTGFLVAINTFSHPDMGLAAKVTSQDSQSIKLGPSNLLGWVPISTTQKPKISQLSVFIYIYAHRFCASSNSTAMRFGFKRAQARMTAAGTGFNELTSTEEVRVVGGGWMA